MAPGSGATLVRANRAGGGSSSRRGGHDLGVDRTATRPVTGASTTGSAPTASGATSSGTPTRPARVGTETSRRARPRRTPTRQAELRGKIAKGERVAPSKVTFEALAREYLEQRAKPKLGGRTYELYEGNLERHVFRGSAARRHRPSRSTTSPAWSPSSRRRGRRPGRSAGSSRRSRGRSPTAPAAASAPRTPSARSSAPSGRKATRGRCGSSQPRRSRASSRPRRRRGGGRCSRP